MKSIKNRLVSVSVTLAMMITMLIASQMTALAEAPAIEDIEHKGKGRVEVDFYGDVQYNNVKITVKDTSGKKYGVKNVWKDDDEINFTIKKFKQGKTYKFTIKGIKNWGSVSYGKVSGKIKTPAPSKGTTISADKARSIAKNHAKSTWGTKDIYAVHAERDRYSGVKVWEVDFDGYENGVLYEYSYEINRSSGKILHYEREMDD